MAVLSAATLGGVHLMAFATRGMHVARLQGNPDLTVTSFSEPSGYIFGQNFERTDLDHTGIVDKYVDLPELALNFSN